MPTHLVVCLQMCIFASVNENKSRLKMFYVANIQNKYEKGCKKRKNSHGRG